MERRDCSEKHFPSSVRTGFLRFQALPVCVPVGSLLRPLAPCPVSRGNSQGAALHVPPCLCLAEAYLFCLSHFLPEEIHLLGMPRGSPAEVRRFSAASLREGQSQVLPSGGL